MRHLTFVLLATFLGAASAQEPAVFYQAPRVEESTVSKPVAPAAPAPVKKTTVKGGPRTKWIWGDSVNSNYVFYKTFDVKDARSAALIATCDNEMVIFLNGKRVASGANWQSPELVDVSRHLLAGKNELRVRGTNQGSVAGLALKLAWKDKAKKSHYVVTDASWKVAKKGNARSRVAARVVGKMGDGPWGNVFASSGRPSLLPAIPRNVFTLLPGYQVELLYTVPKGSQGSWVSMTFDNKGRIIASDQGAKGLYRITPPRSGTQEKTKVEKLNVRMSSAQGMLYAFDSLYVVANGGPGSGLYRLQDTNGDDQFDRVTRLQSIRGGGEHGPHAVRLSPDGKSLYVIAGNHTDLPEVIRGSTPHNWSEDLLLPRRWDARGHARGKLAPGGWICKTDPEGKNWEVVSMGYRNPYDMDFNPEGELFAYDADMEWDMGSPWYRPTRVVHAVNGSEFGWRSGTGKWPTYYADSLPPAVNIGPGSPTGAAFGTGAKFPARYQRALFIVDWTFATMYAVHLEPHGSSYRAVKEEFLSRVPLPLTDLAVGPDGAMYFTVGGRGTQSALYRVTYRGSESTAPAAADLRFADLRAQRRALEALQRRVADPAAAVEQAWRFLGNRDRHLRYAARIVLEHQDVAMWQKRAMNEVRPQAFITATLALARVGDKKLQSRILEKLRSLDFSKLTGRQQLEWLRAYGLVCIRMGRPAATELAKLSAGLDKFYPAKSDDLNRELCRLLVYANAPSVVRKTMAMILTKSDTKKNELPELLARNSGYGGTIASMLANRPDGQKLHYAFVLRNVRFGWTLEERRAYHEWLNEARQKSGGASYKGFIDNMRKDALVNTSEAEKKALAATTVQPPPKATELPKPKGPGRVWTLSEVVDAAKSGLRGRSFENGRRTYAAAKCASCHRFVGDGGSTGPDLTNAAGRFSLRDLTESLIHPSRVISDQYQAHQIRTAKGKVLTGRITSKANGVLTVVVDAFDATKVVKIRRDDVSAMQPSKVSLMPKDLLNTLNRDEVLDLLAYLMSRGNPNDPAFRR